MVADPDELLTGLDGAQLAAVISPAQPLCVLAGAGSGKTRVLTRRIAWRSATGLEDPRRTLALTFTRAAAVELATRLRVLGLRDGVRAGTFHAVAWAELRGRASELGRTPPVLTDRPARMLARLADDLDRRAIAEVVGEIGWARARCITPERYPAEADRARRTPSVGTARVAELTVAYAAAKRKRGVVDFDDLLEHLTRILHADTGFADAQRWRFAHLYVDEFQDLNPLQHRLLEAWRGGRPALTAVGDPNQSIYGWNGSDPAFVEQFTELYPGGEVLAIDRNHRSSAPILEVANALLDAGSLGGVRLQSVRGEGPPPLVLGYRDDEEEARAIARAVLDAKLPGTAWGHQAVLVRTNAQLPTIEEALTAVGIPVRVRGKLPFHEHPVVRAALRELGPSAADFAEGIGALAAGLPGDLDTGIDSLPDTRAGGGRDSDDDVEDERAALRTLVELAEQFTRLVHRPDAAGFRGWLLAEADDGAGGDGVDLLTFHAAKGREWPMVHLAGIEDGLVPISHARTPAARTEERRLLYVAITRAERDLRISWAATRRFGNAEARSMRQPSPLLAEVAPVLGRLRREASPAPTPPAHRRAPAPVDTLEAATVAAAAERTQALEGWRNRRARAAGVAPRTVLADVVLAQVAEEAPADEAALATIPGTRPLLLAGLASEVVACLRGCAP